jgi:hypothetical protein
MAFELEVDVRDRQQTFSGDDGKSRVENTV